MGHTVETCRSCGSQQLQWEKDNGWLTGSVRYLRCQRCLDCVRVSGPPLLWIFLTLAAAAAVWGWWTVTR